MDKDKPRVQFSLRFDNYIDLLERVKEYCQANRLSLTEFTATALQNALEMGLSSLPIQLTSNDKINYLEQSSHDKINQLETKIAALEENLVMASQRLENMDQRLGKLNVRQGGEYYLCKCQ